MATAGTGDLQPLSWVPLTSTFDVSFWKELTRQKLDVQRLDTSALQVHGFYETPLSGAPEKCFFGGESFGQPGELKAARSLLKGDLKNFNTLEDFKDFITSGGAKQMVAGAVTKLIENIISGAALEDPLLLRPFIIVTFANLKTYHFSHTTAFPVFVPGSPHWLSAPAVRAEEAGFSRDFLAGLSSTLKEKRSLVADGAFLLARSSADVSWETRPLSALRGAAASDDLTVVVVDSTAADTSMSVGAPARNLFAALAHFRPGKYKVLAFRDPHLASNSAATEVRSRVFFVDASMEALKPVLDQQPMPAASALGKWSKVTTYDLTVFMDKKSIAADAVDLNIKLIKWRMLPDMEPERMKELRFLLLGSGTLGCSIARGLMGWGVRKMTFVDGGKVSFSNPVRQSLYTHEDAASSRSKATAAAEAVLAIMPDAEVRDIELDIPMPGHPHKSQEVLRKNIQQLRDLIGSHDVVCMLTDSRESRWLPSLLVAAAQQKRAPAVAARAEATATPVFEPPPREPNPPLGITVALGFDSFLVQRQSFLESPAACYFCNDVTAPRDSLAFRTLDQQCTVTRPGLSGMSAGIAVELIASLVQHEDGFQAKPTGKPSCLGVVPHQIRGFLAEFKLAPMETEPFPMCICCSKGILERYEEEGDDFIARIIQNSAELEEISGLAKMKAAVNSEDCLNFDDFDDEDE